MSLNSTDEEQAATAVINSGAELGKSDEPAPPAPLDDQLEAEQLPSSAPEAEPAEPVAEAPADSGPVNVADAEPLAEPQDTTEADSEVQPAPPPAEEQSTAIDTADEAPAATEQPPAIEPDEANSEPPTDEAPAAEANVPAEAPVDSEQPAVEQPTGEAVAQAEGTVEGVAANGGLEYLVSNALAGGAEGQNILIMTDDGPQEINIADLVNAGAASGQTFIIETPDGYVTCGAPAAVVSEENATGEGLALTGSIEGTISDSQTLGDTKVVQSVDTPRVTAALTGESNAFGEQNFDGTTNSSLTDITDGNVLTSCVRTEEQSELEPSAVDEQKVGNAEAALVQQAGENAVLNIQSESEPAAAEATIDPASFDQTGVVQVTANVEGGGATLEDLASLVQGAEGQNIVIMTEDGPQEINIADLVNAGAASGQTFIIETPEGYVTCGAPSIVDEEAAAENIVVTGTEGIAEGQVIHATTAGGQTVTYTVQSGQGDTLELYSSVNQSPSKNLHKKQLAGRNNQKVKMPGETLLMSNKPGSMQISSQRTPSPQKKRPFAGGLSKTIGAPVAVQPDDNGGHVTVTRFSPQKSSSSISISSSLGIPSSSPAVAAITASAPGPSQLASSRRTYSKKNIVWLNAEPEHTPVKPLTPIVKPADGQPRKSNILPSAQARSTPLVKPTVNAITTVEPVRRSNILPSARAALNLKSDSAETPRRSNILPSVRTTKTATPETRAVTSKPQPIISVTKTSTPLKGSTTPPSAKANPITVMTSPTLASEKANAIEELKKSPLEQDALKKATDNEAQDDLPPAPISPPKRRGRPPKNPPSAQKNAVVTSPAKAKSIDSSANNVSSPQVNQNAATAQNGEVTPTPRRRGRPPKRPIAVAAQEAKKPAAEQEQPPEKVVAKEQPKVTPAPEPPLAETPTRSRRSTRSDSASKEPEPTVQPKLETGRRSSAAAAKTAAVVDTKETKKSEKVEADEQAEQADGKRRRSTRQSATSSEDEEVTKDAKRKPAKEPEKAPLSPARRSARTSSASKKDEVDGKAKAEPEQEPVARSPEPQSASKKRVGFKIAEEEEEASASKRPRRLPATPAPAAKAKPSEPKIQPILKSPRTPENRRASIPQTPELRSFSEVDPEAELQDLQRSIAQLDDSRDALEVYDYQNAECRFHIRQQSPGASHFTPTESGGSYCCQKCGYRTTRLNNLVWHHKDQCAVFKNQLMLSWENEIKKQMMTSLTKKEESAEPEKKRRLSDADLSSPSADEFDQIDSPIIATLNEDPVPTAAADV